MWIVYKTVNLINNKYYIGVHNLESKKGSFYLGSGKLIQQAIKKYGKENFIRETIKTFTTEIDAYTFEKALLTEEYLKDQNCYNIIEGGGNPPTFYGKDNPFYGKTHSKEVLEKIRLANVGKIPWNKGVPHTEVAKNNISKARKGKNKGVSNHMYGKKLPKERRAKLKDFEKGNIPWNKGVKGGPPPYSTTCVVHGMLFNSTTEAARCLGISRATVRRRCTEYNFPDCYYIK